jgi:hypothetical protein
MPAQTEPRSGIKHSWPAGYPYSEPGAPAAGWKPEMDANLIALGRHAMPLYVLDRDLTTPPLSPASGDTYIPAAAATDDWEGHDGKLAVWDGDAWVFYDAIPGQLAVIEDESKLVAKMASGWSAGVEI